MDGRARSQGTKSSSSLRVIRAFIGVALIFSVLTGIDGELREAALLIAFALAFTCMHENEWMLDTEWRELWKAHEPVRRLELMIAAWLLAGGALLIL